MIRKLLFKKEKISSAKTKLPKKTLKIVIINLTLSSIIVNQDVEVFIQVGIGRIEAVRARA